MPQPFCLLFGALEGLHADAMTFFGYPGRKVDGRAINKSSSRRKRLSTCCTSRRGEGDGDRRAGTRRSCLYAFVVFESELPNTNASTCSYHVEILKCRHARFRRTSGKAQANSSHTNDVAVFQKILSLVLEKQRSARKSIW